MRTQTTTVCTEEHGHVEVEFQWWEGEREDGEFMFSLGSPASPPEIEVIRVWRKGQDITHLLDNYAFSEIEDELWGITEEDF